VSRPVIDATDPTKASQYGAAEASFIFIVTFAFGAIWLTIPWLYLTEICLELRVKGNACGVVGWSIGNWLASMQLPPQKSSVANQKQTLIYPVMFDSINEKTIYIFGISNVITIPWSGHFTPSPTNAHLRKWVFF
jgi:hypothetical protein